MLLSKASGFHQMTFCMLLQEYVIAFTSLRQNMTSTHDKTLFSLVIYPPN